MDIYELATLMHDKLCSYDHTDCCDWYYRDNDKDKWTQGRITMHKVYLEKAEIVVAHSGLPISDIAKVFLNLKKG